MSSYALFGGNRFYPAGGIEDFKGFFETVEEAEQHVLENYDMYINFDWYHIACKDSFTIIASGNGEDLK